MFGRINVGILGTGNIAETMAATIRTVPGVNAYAVASRTQFKADAFADQHGFKKAYGSYEELLRDRKVHLVYIATPHSEHYANMRLCLDYGKAVLCEKAFTINLRQAEDIFRIAEEKKIFVAEAMWVRFMPMLQTMQDIIASNAIGEPKMMVANLGYNVSQVKRVVDPSLGGGALLDLGVYTLNFASMLFGNDIVNISTSCSFNTETGVDMEDSITLRYRDGKMACLSATANAVSDRRGVIYGTKGYMVVENINNFESAAVYDYKHERISFTKRPRQKTGYEYELKACVRALKNGWLECPEMPHRQTLSIMHQMDTIRSVWGLKYPADQELIGQDPSFQDPSIWNMPAAPAPGLITASEPLSEPVAAAPEVSAAAGDVGRKEEQEDPSESSIEKSLRELLFPDDPDTQVVMVEGLDGNDSSDDDDDDGAEDESGPDEDGDDE